MGAEVASGARAEEHEQHSHRPLTCDPSFWDLHNSAFTHPPSRLCRTGLFHPRGPLLDFLLKTMYSLQRHKTTCVEKQLAGS